MYNKVILVGNLTRDVELRYTQSGMAVAVLGLASNRKYKKQDGSQGEEACFIDCKLFGRTAEVLVLDSIYHPKRLTHSVL